MNVEEFERLLYDMYQMDVCMPPFFGKWKEEYKNISYSLWAVNELKDYISERICPRTYGTVEEFCNLTKEFMKKTDQYARVNSKTSQIFQAARDMAIAVLELLEAMK